jgi:hypothetical protein
MTSSGRSTIRVGHSNPRRPKRAQHRLHRGTILTPYHVCSIHNLLESQPQNTSAPTQRPPFRQVTSAMTDPSEWADYANYGSPSLPSALRITESKMPLEFTSRSALTSPLQDCSSIDVNRAATRPGVRTAQSTPIPRRPTRTHATPLPSPRSQPPPHPGPGRRPRRPRQQQGPAGPAGPAGPVSARIRHIQAPPHRLFRAIRTLPLPARPAQSESAGPGRQTQAEAEPARPAQSERERESLRLGHGDQSGQNGAGGRCGWENRGRDRWVERWCGARR